MPEVRVAWSPQAGPQQALVECPLPEIFFGGSRGGGKTDGVLGKYAIKAGRYHEAFNAVFFRKEMPQTDDLIERAKQIYLPIGAAWKDQARMFRFPGGGRVRFRPLESVADAEKYQGQNLSDAAVEEAGNYADPAPIDRLNGCLRSAGGVPTQLILTANPGGVGQHWIKARYIDPAPRGMKILTRNLPNGAAHRYVYIPSRVQHNRVLLDNDPEYVNRLYLVGSPELVRAWLEGDWNVVFGAFFPEFGPKHIIEPLELPREWTRYRSMDWGSAKPFSVGWYAVSDGSLPAFPRGALIKYNEWYGMADGQPNTGLRLTAEEVGRGIMARDYDVEIDPLSVIDPAAYAEDGGPSIAERMFRVTDGKVSFRRADNKRIGKLGALGGWDQLRARLKGDGERPMIYFFSTCTHTIRTIPALQHDRMRAEDVDTEGEDHAGDETRYACMARPYVQEVPRPIIENWQDVGRQTIDEIVEEHMRMRTTHRRI